MNVVIIGSGAWGATLAGLVTRAGSKATLVVRNPETYRSLSKRRRHPVSLPGYTLPTEVQLARSIEDALDTGPDLVIVAVPTAAIDDVGEVLARSHYRGPIVTATKGLDPDTLRTASDRICDAIEDELRLAVLSGPNLANEIAAGLPAAAVVAAHDEPVSQVVRRALMSDGYRVYTSSDVTGVEIAGALKNVIAIGAGIADGMNAGQNAKAAYMTRGIAEMARLGVACGANPMTFAGLAGIGDLMATCNSEQSRNHTVGRGLAMGRPLEEILAGMHEVAEGVPTTKAALRLGKVKGVEMPIVAQLAAIMYEGLAPEDAIAELMAREATGELNF